MKKLLLILFAFALSGGMAWGQTTYSEDFETSSNWAGGTMTGYNAKTYTDNTTDPSNDQFSTNSAVRETSSTHNSSSYAWRVDDGSGMYLRYECSETVLGFSIYMARWDNSPTPKVEIRYSTNSGTSYTTITTIDGETYFTGNKVYKQYSYSFSSAISPDGGGDKIYIEFYTTTGERMLYDDFELTYGTASNDQTTEVYAFDPQIAAGTISSLDDTQGEAVDVFKMTIEDQGSGDGLPTHVTNIRVTPYSTNTADWTNTIQGVTLNDGSAVTIGTPTITDTYIDIPISSGDLDIADGGSKDVTLAVYLNTGSIGDGDVLSFEVKEASHGFTADASGSDFASTFSSGDFHSNDFTVSVVATKLQFSDVPASVTTNTDFTLTVDAVDANGNTDTDDATSVVLSVKTGSGTLSSATGLTQSLSSGTYSWNDLQYNTAEDFTIAANGGSYTEIVTGTITASEPAKLIISEVADPKDNADARFVELYNAGNNSVDLSAGDYYLSRQANGSTTSWADGELSGVIYPGETFVISYSSSNFNTAYGFDSDINSGSVVTGNGDDGYFLYEGGDHSSGTLVDAYGVLNEDGTGKGWEYLDSRSYRNASVTTANATWTASEWTVEFPTDKNVADMTPGTHGNCITFNGSTNATWSTAGNWVGGSAPTSSKNVKIPSNLTNNPTVDGDATTPSACDNLTIESDASLTIPAGKALTVNGDFSNNGYLTIESNSSGDDGSLIIKGAVSGSGDMNVQRYIAGWGTGDQHGWHLLSSPVSSQNISTVFVDITASPISSNVDFYRWSETENVWINIKKSDGNYNQGTASTNFSNDASPLFSIGTGYLIAYSSNLTKTFMGTPNAANVTISSLSKTNDGWHLLGNPYQSALLWNNTTADWGLGTNFSTTAKIWNESSASYTDISSGNPIPIMQGFMVQCLTASSSLTIPTSDRTHNTTQWYKNSSIDLSKNTLKLIVSETENNTAQESIIRVNTNATDEFDSKFDSHFLAGFAPQFYSVLDDGTALSTNAIPSVSSKTISFIFVKNSAMEYDIKAEGIETFDNNVAVYLTDLKTNHTQKLNDNPVYHFTAGEGDIQERFELHFGPVGIDNHKSVENRINVFTANNQIEIRSKLPLNGVVQVYNITGQLMFKTSIHNQSSASINAGSLKGIVIVSVVDNNKVFNQKVLIK